MGQPWRQYHLRFLATVNSKYPIFWFEIYVEHKADLSFDPKLYLKTNDDSLHHLDRLVDCHTVDLPWL